MLLPNSWYSRPPAVQASRATTQRTNQSSDKDSTSHNSAKCINRQLLSNSVFFIFLSQSDTSPDVAALTNITSLSVNCAGVFFKCLFISTATGMRHRGATRLHSYDRLTPMLTHVQTTSPPSLPPPPQSLSLGLHVATGFKNC